VPAKTLTLDLKRYRAAGNRVLALDGRPIPGDVQLETLARRTLRAHPDQDGLLIYKGVRGRAVTFLYLDPSGRAIPFCGNAVRVLPYFAQELGDLDAGDALVETSLGTYEVLVRESSNEVVLDLGVPDPFRPDFPVLGERLALVGVGAPHLVRLTESPLKDTETFAFRVLELYPRVNVNVAHPEGDILFNRTFEGSRKGEVDGCATGSAAAGIAFMKAWTSTGSIRVRVRSGEEIDVHLDPESDRASLRGPIVREEDVKETVAWDTGSPS
jgi:diaminopimelate epimerase